MSTDLPGILIVDDNKDNRYTLELMLTSDGHERIASAASGNEALALIEKEKFSLVLLDLMMPDLNGDEVLKVIKSDPEKRDIPVVMISADTDAEKVAQCIELGADDYLPKPFNPTLLRARVGATLERKKLHDQVRAQAADLAAWNQTLEQRVADQLTEIERVARLK